MTAHFTVTRSRDFDRPTAEIFAAWIDPAMRRIFETPEGSGMRHGMLDTREGGMSEVIVERDGREVGRMFDTIRILRPPHLMVVQGWGVFGGETTMSMQTTFEVTARAGTGREGGCTLTGTSQMVVLGDMPTESQVGEGWDGMLDRFAAALTD